MQYVVSAGAGFEISWCAEAGDPVTDDSGVSMCLVDAAGVLANCSPGDILMASGWPSFRYHGYLLSVC